jgi:hypothetical protein
VTHDAEISVLQANVRNNSTWIYNNSIRIWNNSRELKRVWAFVLGDFELPGWWTDYESLAEIVAETRDLAFANSTAIQQFDQGIRTNSNAIVTHDREIRQNSNAILKLSETSGDLAIQNSNAIVTMKNSVIDRITFVDGGALYIEGGTFYVLKNWEPADGPLHGGGMIISSIIDLSGSTFENHGDLHLSSQTKFPSSGYLSPHTYAYVLGGDMIVPDGVDITFTTSGILDGRGHNIIFGRNSSINLDTGVTLTLRHVGLRRIKDNPNGGASLGVKRPHRADLTLQDVVVHLERDFTFTYCPLYITGDVIISGTHTFVYTSTHDMRIATASLFGIDMNTTFSYAPRSANKNLIIMRDKTSMLMLTGGTLKTINTGLQLTKGTLVVDHKSYLVNTATSLSEAIVFGDGTASNDLGIEILPGGSLDLLSGIVDYKNVN